MMTAPQPRKNYDPRVRTLYSGTDTYSGLYELDPATGLASFVGAPGVEIDGLTFDSTRNALVSLDAGDGDLYEIDPVAVSATLLVDGPYISNAGLAYDAALDLFYAIETSGNLYSYDPNNAYVRSPEPGGLGTLDGFVHVPFAP